MTEFKTGDIVTYFHAFHQQQEVAKVISNGYWGSDKVVDVVLLDENGDEVMTDKNRQRTRMKYPEELTLVSAA